MSLNITDRQSDYSPLVELVRPYIQMLFVAFLKDAATPADFNLLMGAEQGTVDSVLHEYIVNSSALDISFHAHSGSMYQNPLAIRTYNLCAHAQRQGILGCKNDYQIESQNLRQKKYLSRHSNYSISIQNRDLYCWRKQIFPNR